MISIIICSINPFLLKKVSDSINKTIGIPFELIAIDNRENNYGICKVYNLGALKSKYDALCFIHEDIVFREEEWGAKLLQHLSNDKVGMVGVAGGVAKSKFHSSWWSNLSSTQIQRKNIIQHSKTGNISEYQNPDNEITSDVLFIDGVFMACRKEIWEQNQFDEESFPRFHFYDLDFSYAIHQNHKVQVVYDILIEHYSKGSYNTAWIVAAERFTKKWKHKLPEYLMKLSLDDKKKLEFSAMDFFVNACFQEKLIRKSFNYSIHFFLKYPSIKLFFNLLKKHIRLTFSKFKL